MEWYRKDRVPLVLGHEIAGEVVEIGENVHTVEVGDRVVASHHVPCLKCRYCLRGNETLCKTLRSTNFEPGGFSQYVRMPEINTRLGIFKIPDHVSYEEASFAEPVACVIRGQRRANVRKGDIVVVIGSGISGVLHIALAKAMGVETIIAVDIKKQRLQWATKFGADLVTQDSDKIPIILDKEIGRRADVVILTTGNLKAIQDGFDSVENGGIILLFAPTDPGKTIPLNINELFWKRDVTLTTTYANSPNDLKEALRLISEKVISVGEMITHRIGLEEIQLGFNLVANGSDSLKVIVEPNRDKELQTNND